MNTNRTITAIELEIQSVLALKTRTPDTFFQDVLEDRLIDLRVELAQAYQAYHLYMDCYGYGYELSCNGQRVNIKDEHSRWVAGHVVDAELYDKRYQVERFGSVL